MQPVTIHQPAPCHENWAAMTPTDQGRHCAACQTEVVDFTRMTDGEVLAFLRHTIPGRRCGMFRDDQVGRPLLPAARPVTGWRRWAGAAVLLLGSAFGMKARAQEGRPGANPQPMEPAAGKTTAAASPDSMFLVQGVVRNRWGVRKAGARVQVAGISDTTNAKGYFGIWIPQSKRTSGRYITVRCFTRKVHVRLMARVPLDSTRTKLYHIRLYRAIMRNPGFY